MNVETMFLSAVAVALMIFIVILVGYYRSGKNHHSPVEDDMFETTPTSIHLDQTSIYWTNNNTNSWFS